MKGGINMRRFNNAAIFDVSNLFNEHSVQRNKTKKHNVTNEKHNNISNIKDFTED